MADSKSGAGGKGGSSDKGDPSKSEVGSTELADAKDSKSGAGGKGGSSDKGDPSKSEVGSTELADAKDSKSGAGGKGGEGGPAPAAAAAQSLDATTADDRRAALETKAVALEGEKAKLEQKIAALSQENSDLRAEVTALRKQNSQLEQLVPVKAPSGSARLKESTVIFSHVGRGRIYAKRGDVLLIEASKKELEEAQRAVGTAANVYSISRDDAKELAEGGYVEENR